MFFTCTVVCFEMHECGTWMWTSFSKRLLAKKNKADSFLGIICFCHDLRATLKTREECVLEETIQSVREQQRKREYKTGSGLRALSKNNMLWAINS